MSTPEVIVTKVASSKQKLKWLNRSVSDAFSEGKHILIFVSSLEVAQFVDHFLWEQPTSSFLPHSIADQASQDPIVISWQMANLNQAEVIINLSTTAVKWQEGIEKIFELDDGSKPATQELLMAKLTYYQEVGLPIHREGS